MAVWPPSGVVPGIALGRIGLSHAAIPFIAHDFWPVEVRPPSIEFVAHGGVVQIGWSNQVLRDFAVLQHPRVELVPEKLPWRAIVPSGPRKVAAPRSFGTANGERHGVDHHLGTRSGGRTNLFQGLQQQTRPG